MYRKIAIGLGVATMATAGIYGRGVEVAEENHAPHSPLYGALGFLALALLLCAFGFYALHAILVRPPAATATDGSTTDVRPEPPLEGIDDAPTAPIPGQSISVRLPRPRSHVYQCGPEGRGSTLVRAEPVTIEMIPVRVADTLLATVQEGLHRVQQIERDRAWLQAVDDVSETVLGRNDGEPNGATSSPPVAGDGVDPEAIEAIRRLDRRLRGEQP